MRLCGVGIPWEHQFAEKTASNRIHATSELGPPKPILQSRPFSILKIEGYSSFCFF